MKVLLSINYSIQSGGNYLIKISFITDNVVYEISSKQVFGTLEVNFHNYLKNKVEKSLDNMLFGLKDNDDFKQFLYLIKYKYSDIDFSTLYKCIDKECVKAWNN